MRPSLSRPPPRRFNNIVVPSRFTQNSIYFVALSPTFFKLVAVILGKARLESVTLERFLFKIEALDTCSALKLSIYGHTLKYLTRIIGKMEFT